MSSCERRDVSMRKTNSKSSTLESLILFFVMSMICFIMILSIPLQSYSGKLYKWVDKNGGVVISDIPPDPSKISKNDKVRTYYSPNVSPNKEISTAETKEEKPIETQYSHKIEKKTVPASQRYEKETANQAERVIIRNRKIFIPVPRTYDTRRKRYKKERTTIRKNNESVKRHNARVSQENKRRRQEYEKEKRRIERLNAEINKKNAEVKRHNDMIKRKMYLQEKKKADTRRRQQHHVNRDYNRKPYYDGNYHEMMHR